MILQKRTIKLIEANYDKQIFISKLEKCGTKLKGTDKAIFDATLIYLNALFEMPMDLSMDIVANYDKAILFLELMERMTANNNCDALLLFKEICTYNIQYVNNVKRIF